MMLVLRRGFGGERELLFNGGGERCTKLLELVDEGEDGGF